MTSLGFASSQQLHYIFRYYTLFTDSVHTRRFHTLSILLVVAHAAGVISWNAFHLHGMGLPDSAPPVLVTHSCTNGESHEQLGSVDRCAMCWQQLHRAEATLAETMPHAHPMGGAGTVRDARQTHPLSPLLVLLKRGPPSA